MEIRETRKARKPVPGGIENFQELRRRGFYYVDKTGLLTEMLRNPWKVTLFTRPRRFGKTLMLDTIRSFFEIGADPTDFEGLAIAEEKELCQAHMGQYPVISISLKNVAGRDYTAALDQLRRTVQTEVERIADRLDEEQLNRRQMARLDALLDRGIAENDLQDSLRQMSQLLRSYYGKPVILLIDEYDVPLDKAFHAKRPYYDEMAGFLRGFLGGALKTNPDLHFAVLTGCLRIARESIFTGLNNFQVMTISDTDFADSFGFTAAEVREMLGYYDLTERYDTVRDWYDGYLFGDEKIFCPWDVINYVYRARRDPARALQNYWANSSGNDIIRRLIEQAGLPEKKEIEALMQGGSVRKKIQTELTYADVYQSPEHIWSILYTTGYLTRSGELPKDGDRALSLTIPNREIRQVYEDQIWEWFSRESRKQPETLREFCRAFENGDAARAEALFDEYLLDMISIRDTAARKPYREQFYHGLLLGLLRSAANGSVSSNEEAGTGYSDLIVRLRDGTSAIVIELKYAHDGNLDQAAEAALRQIQEKGYDSSLRAERFPVILHYGVACFRKSCRILLEVLK